MAENLWHHHRPDREMVQDAVEARAAATVVATAYLVLLPF
jgi:hypothetical protein